MYCNRKLMLKIGFLYKQSKSCHPQVYAEECKYADKESQHCRILSDSNDDEGIFKVA